MRLRHALRELRRRFSGRTSVGIIRSVTSSRDCTIVHVTGVLWPIVLLPGEALQLEETGSEVLLVKLAADGERLPVVGYPKG